MALTDVLDVFAANSLFVCNIPDERSVLEAKSKPKDDGTRSVIVGTKCRTRHKMLQDFGNIAVEVNILLSPSDHVIRG